MATAEHIKRCELHAKWRELLHGTSVSFAKPDSLLLVPFQVNLPLNMKRILVRFLAA